MANVSYGTCTEERIDDVQEVHAITVKEGDSSTVVNERSALLENDQGCSACCNRRQSIPNEIPVHSSWFFSVLTFHWITGFVWRVYKQGVVDTSTLWRCPPEETSEVNGKRFHQMWKDEIARRGLSRALLGSVLFRFIRTQMILLVIANVASAVFSLLTPALFFRFLLEYIQYPDSDIGYGLALTAGLLCSELGRTFTLMLHFRLGYNLGIRAKNGLMYVIYNKILKLRSINGKSVGEFVNFCANDCQRVFEFCWLAPTLFGGIFTAIAGTVYCVVYIGWWTLLGAGVIGLYYPFQLLIYRVTAYVRKRCITITDRRVRLMAEILCGIKLIKFHAWEKSFSRKIADVRRDEKGWLQRAAFLQTVSIAVTPLVPFFAAIATFLAIILSGSQIDAAEAFVVIAIYNISQVKVQYIPQMVRVWSETNVALTRAKEILEMEEIDAEAIASRTSNPLVVIQVINATFAWDEINGKQSTTTHSDGEHVQMGARAQKDGNISEAKLTAKKKKVPTATLR